MTRAGNVLVTTVGAVGVVALLAGGCSSDEAIPATTIAEPTVVETLSPSPTTDPPPTTAAPTTTLDPATALAQQVEADLLEAFRLLNVGLQDPTDDGKRTAALERFIGANRDFVDDRFDEFVSKGYAIRQNSTIQPVILIESPAELVAPSTDLARIQVCDVDSWITVEPGAGASGSDAVVDPDVIAYRTVFFMRDVDGVWKVEGGEQLGEWPGVEICPPA